jgi:hypothetical protein
LSTTLSGALAAVFGPAVAAGWAEGPGRGDCAHALQCVAIVNDMATVNADRFIIILQRNARSALHGQRGNLTCEFMMVI